MKRDAAAVVVLAALSLLRWGNAHEEVAMYLPLVRDLAGTWPAPPDDQLLLLRRLPHAWCRVAALFEARGLLYEFLLVAVVFLRVALAAAAVALAAAQGARGPARWVGPLFVVLAVPWELGAGELRLVEAEGLLSRLGVPLALGAVALAGQGRVAWAGAVLGLAGTLHPPQAVASLPAVLAAGVVAAPGERLRAVARMLAAAAVVAAPTAALVLARPGQDIPRAEAYALLRQTTGGHVFFPTSAHALGSLALLMALVLSTARLGAVSGRADLRRRVGARALSAAAVAGLVVQVGGAGLASAELLPLVALKAHLPRAGLVALAVTLVLLGRTVVVTLARPASRRCAAAASLAVAGLLHGAAVLGLGLALAPPARRRGLVFYSTVTAAIVGAALIGGPDLPRALVLVVVLLVVARVARRRRPARRRAALVAGGLAAVVVVWHVDPSGVALGLRIGTLTVRPHGPGAAERAELAAWIASATPVTARLLAPPEERMLVPLCGRPVVASVQRAVQAPWDLRAGAAEVERLAATGWRFGGGPAADASYHRWPSARTLGVARRLGATHVVIDRSLGEPALGPALFENLRFRVHAVRP